MVAILRELNARDRADHPADRARHARRDGARDAACWCCITARPIARGHAGRRWCASRRWSSPISARRRCDAHRREPRCVLRRRAGARRRLARSRGGRDRRDRRRQRRRQDLADPHHRRHAAPGARPRSAIAAATSRAGRATASAISASARWPRAARCFRRSPSLENLEMGAMLPRARAEQRAKPRARVRACFRGSRSARGQAAGTLSGGEQQMLAIGRCLMGSPTS